MSGLRRATCLAALAVALVAAGCGDDGGDAGASGGTVRAEIEPVGSAGEGIDGVESFRVESNEHTNASIDYAVVPPPGGPHHQVWANCGFYDAPLPDEHIVHALEHGAVWLAYAPDLPDADVTVVRELTRLHDKVITTPYEQLDEGEAVVASAWARQLRLDSVDDPRLERFVVQYEDGGQSPEAGVTCRGTDVGEPLE